MTKQSERLWNLPDDKRDRLLIPAEAEFIENGFAGASLNRILSEAKMSKGQAYYYVAGKSDLYLAVCTRHFIPLLESVEEISKSIGKKGKFWHDVEILVGMLAQLLAKNERLSALALTVYESSSASKCLEPLTLKLDALMDAIIQTGQDHGEIRTDLPDVLVRDMLKSLARSIDKWFALNASSLSSAEANNIFKCALKMIRNFVQPNLVKESDA